jgi:hypothetical protein
MPLRNNGTPRNRPASAICGKVLRKSHALVIAKSQQPSDLFRQFDNAKNMSQTSRKTGAAPTFPQIPIFAAGNLESPGFAGDLNVRAKPRSQAAILCPQAHCDGPAIYKRVPYPLSSQNCLHRRTRSDLVLAAHRVVGHMQPGWSCGRVAEGTALLKRHTC